ncbi:hypothetical protein B9T25_01860 [Acinetobacter sp. ANC 4470]|nr:hypothetical protein B9T25_01860 [Acinetobacter sp. ANC 4470]
MYFESPLLDRVKEETKINIIQTPYFYNDDGRPTYLTKLPDGVVPLKLAKISPKYKVGREYSVPHVLGTKVEPPYGEHTQLEFDVEIQEFEYEPMWVTRDNAAAFGITLIEKGQAIEIHSPVPILSDIEYEYGVFAGHWCPYLEGGKQAGEGKTLFPFVCTDLEHHNFPHIFASTDRELPLVISVARYWPEKRKIYLADLWVPRGHALYIPPRPKLERQKYIDLHNNRNSARACWGQLDKNTLSTHTMLQKDGYFYWYWNKKPTLHGQLPILSPVT